MPEPEKSGKEGADRPGRPTRYDTETQTDEEKREQPYRGGEREGPGRRTDRPPK